MAQNITNIRQAPGFADIDLRTKPEQLNNVDELETRFFKETRSWQEVLRDQNQRTPISLTKRKLKNRRG